MTAHDASLRPRYREVVALAPSGVTTGGPELIHQLVHEIRTLGGQASITYRPDPTAEIPDRYRVYNLEKSETLPTSADCCIVAPETMVRELPLTARAVRIIWWLSYDFFVSRRQTAIGRLIANAYKNSLIHVMTRAGVRHLFQSDYARLRLADRGIGGALLSDYLSTSTEAAEMKPREDVILYNPKKGLDITETLQSTCPNFVFKPIINMTKQQVEDAFASAKVYIDFGEHPGKDRLPREAAMLGTVVVVGARGSAANTCDMPLADVYKLAIDETLPARFETKIVDIFANFGRHRDQQADYRQFIAQERSVFTQQVKDKFFFRSHETAL